MKRLFGLCFGACLTGAILASVPAKAELNFDPAAALGALAVEERASFRAMTPEHLDKISALAPKISLIPPQKPKAPPMTPTREWLAKQPAVKNGSAEWECLTQALYFEARGETHEGLFAVAEVIMNRVDSPRFPNSICGVIHQGTGRKYQCQFTFTCDGRPEHVKNPKAYVRVGKVAKAMIDGAPRPLTNGATYYHTTAVNPRWAAKFSQTAQIGVHKFYRR